MGAKAVLMREANYEIEQQDDAIVPSDDPELSHLDVEEEVAVKRGLLKRQRTSPDIVINRNGSRFILPLDIVRSKLGREEILKQTSQNERPNAPSPQAIEREEKPVKSS